MKKDLKDVTFVIPVRIDSVDRIRNLFSVLLYLLSNFETNIIVKELGEISHYNNDVVPLLKQVFDDIPVEYIHEKTSEQVFHKTKVLNELAALIKTPIGISYDTDIILPVESYLEARRMVAEGDADLVYPFGFNEHYDPVNGYAKLVTYNDSVLNEFYDSSFDINVLLKRSQTVHARYGYCQFYNMESFNKAGKWSEKFVSFGAEDEEFYYRFHTLGFNVKRIDDFAYHLNHSRDTKFWFHNDNGHFSNNEDLWQKIQKMGKEELIEFYNLSW